MSPEAISWRTSFGVITHRDPLTRRQSRLGVRRCCATAFSAALMISPATPALLPVASEEHELLGTDSVIRVPKFVQPLSWRYDGGELVRLEYFVTELTTIVSAIDPGSLWCSAASSAAEAITGTPWL